MKRGKDDDKIMGPMFPRLHVNDTERGGPRAPPRNKMALYEQLTVPSQRYNIGAVPVNPNNSCNSVSSTSTHQGTGHERNMYFPLYQPPLGSSYDEFQVRQQEAVTLTNDSAQVENGKKSIEEDDFMVPIFSQPGIGQCDGKTQNSIDGNRQTHLSSKVLPSHEEKQTNRISNGDLSRQLVTDRNGRNLRAYDVPRRLSNISTREKDGGSRNNDSQDLEDSLLAVGARYGQNSSDPPLEGTQKDISFSLKHNTHVRCGYTDADEVEIGMPRMEEDRSLERENTERGNDVSETSMVDSVSGVDICPDDVVGIIGRKHFWKARTAIANQQRVFAVQVFELHRLIKVQRHIAGSPHLLLEGTAFVAKTLKDSAAKKYSSEYAVKALAHTIKHKDDFQKPNDKMEGTAENAVAKVPTHSEIAAQPAGYQPSSVNPASLPPVNADPKMNPWSFQQPPVQQWLVPVMTPSEGLVYKPYPAPGMMSPGCGGYGPAGSTPVMGNLMNLGYGMPNPHYHQGMGGQPAHFGGQGYFPPYPIPMPMMNPAMSGSRLDQMNHFSGLNPYGQMSQPAAGSVNQNLQRQGSCNKPGQKNGIAAPAATAFPPREGERQGSTASSPSERAQVTGTAAPTKGRDALPLFPTAPIIENAEAAPLTEKASRVIKVVPHNPKSTRESAARIFQSIQAERRQYESKSN